jgi:EAL and modified HD-GYP domain-containing signal transduction protein
MERQESVFVARQPIFDRRRNIWGYELFFRNCREDTCALITDPAAATQAVIADGFAIGTRGLPPGRFVCLNICHQDVLNSSPLALPPKTVILEIPMDEAPRMSLAALQGLKAKGYRIALDGYRGQKGLDPLLRLADAVKISFSEHSAQEVVAMRARLKGFPCVLAASKVEDWEGFEGAKALGFQRFQGMFFSAPEVVPGRKVPSGRATRLRLLKALADPDTAVAEVVGAFSADPPLTYRLLSYINSPAFGLGAAVSSLKHAVSLLGLQPLKRWAMAAIISDHDRSDKGSELSWISLHRALFLRLLAENGLAQGWDPEALFLLGLFSNLDSILGLPMASVLEDLPLEGRIKSALGRQDADSSAWLDLLCGLEGGDQEGMRRSLGRLKIPAHRAAVFYMAASTMAAAAADGAGRPA